MVAFLSQKSDQYHGVYIRDETDVQFSPSLRELLRKTFISSLQRIGLLLQMSLDGSASALGRCQQPSKLQNPGTKCFVCRDNRPDVASGVTLVELYRCNHVEVLAIGTKVQSCYSELICTRCRSRRHPIDWFNKRGWGSLVCCLALVSIDQALL